MEKSNQFINTIVKLEQNFLQRSVQLKKKLVQRTVSKKKMLKAKSLIFYLAKPRVMHFFQRQRNKKISNPVVRLINTNVKNEHYSLSEQRLVSRFIVQDKF